MQPSAEDTSRRAARMCARAEETLVRSEEIDRRLERIDNRSQRIHRCADRMHRCFGEMHSASARIDRRADYVNRNFGRTFRRAGEVTTLPATSLRVPPGCSSRSLALHVVPTRCADAPLECISAPQGFTKFSVARTRAPPGCLLVSIACMPRSAAFTIVPETVLARRSRVHEIRSYAPR
jgi:hypothetical protein